MCIDFDGHHSGGSSFVYVNLVQFKIFCIFVLNVYFICKSLLIISP